MAKRAKRTRLVKEQRRKAPAKIETYIQKSGRVKRISTKDSEDKTHALFIVPTHHGQGKNPYGMAQADMKVMEQERINKAEDIMIGFVSGVPEENKNQRLELRLTKLQKDFISKASRVSGFKNVSDYILHISINDSKNVIREQQIFELSERDRVSFMETLENPPEPGKNLKKAMASYLSFQEGK